MAEDTIRIKLESNLDKVANATKGLNLTKTQQESADKYISSAKFGLANQDLKLFQQNFNKLVDLFKNAAASSGTLSKTIEQLTNKQLQLNKEINIKIIFFLNYQKYRSTIILVYLPPT